MKNGNKRHRDFFEKFKKQTILKMMASFTVTAVVATTAVVIINQEQPTLAFNSVSAVGSTVIYDAVVFDPGQTIEDDSLYIYIESSLERYRRPLTLGQNFGTFEMRYLSSEYRLYIKASQGFGAKTFDSRLITSNLSLSGAVVAYEEVESVDDYFIAYELELLVNNVDNQLQDIFVRYGYIESYMYDSYQQEPYEYLTLPVSDTNQKIIITDIPRYNQTVFLYLEGIDSENNTIILDSKIFKTPIEIFGSLYISDLGFDYVSVSPFVEPNNLSAQLAWLELYEGEKQIKKIDIDLTPIEEEQSHYEHQATIINDLKSQATYRLVLKNSYIDSTTGLKNEQTLDQVTFVTLPVYSVDFSISNESTLTKLSLTFLGPSQIFSEPTYEIVATIDNFATSLEYGYFQLVSSSETSQVYEAFTILDFDTTPEVIEIYANKTSQDLMLYSQKVFTYTL